MAARTIARSASHPWITFELDTRRISPRQWVLLGECASKLEHIIGIPLMPEVADRLNRIFVTKGVQGTAAIEGNTLTEDEVEMRLQGELDLPPSQEYLGVEIDNLQKGYRLIDEEIQAAGGVHVNEEQIKKFNRIILRGLQLEEDVVPGEYATRQHGVGKYRAPTPSVIRGMMPSLVEWLNDDEFWNAPQLGHRFVSQILRAMMAHLYVAWIHPFGDGNGRTARMLEAEILAQAGVPEVSYHLLSTHYNLTRDNYYRVLAETSARPKGDPYVFLEYALEGLRDGLRKQIDEVKHQHRMVVWRDFVREHFRGKPSGRTLRLQRLAIELAEANHPVPKKDLWVMNKRIAALYRDRTQKTLTRDVNTLSEKGLIRKTPDGYVANIERLEAFVPRARERS